MYVRMHIILPSTEEERRGERRGKGREKSKEGERRREKEAPYFRIRNLATRVTSS